MTAASFATIRSRAERLFRRIEDPLRIARSGNGRLDCAGRGAMVRVAGRDRGAWASVTVSDNGPGVSEDRLGALFERNDEIPAKGFRVGLALACRVIKPHGRSLVAERSAAGGLELGLRLLLAFVET